jgi:hypothetical protein
MKTYRYPRFSRKVGGGFNSEQLTRSIDEILRRQTFLNLAENESTTGAKVLLGGLILVIILIIIAVVITQYNR